MQSGYRAFIQWDRATVGKGEVAIDTRVHTCLLLRCGAVTGNTGLINTRNTFPGTEKTKA